jgi:hypothetical protein
MFESQMKLITPKMEVPFPRYELTCFIYFKPFLHWRFVLQKTSMKLPAKAQETIPAHLTWQPWVR